MEIDKMFRKYQVKDKKSEIVDFGDVSIRIKREGQGWFVNSLNKDEEEPLSGNFYQTGASDNLILAPALQTKPLVFKGSELSIMPNQKITFFVKIPLLIQIFHTNKHEDNLIKEIPYTRLSDTWFGEPDNGEAAFLLGSEYFFNIEEVEVQPYEAICPIQVFNHSDKLLELQRLIIRVENMTLYKVNQSIYTSLVKLEYKGKEAISSANYGTSKVFHGEKINVLTKPRNDSGSPIMINFHFIRNIYKNL